MGFEVKLKDVGPKKEVKLRVSEDLFKAAQAAGGETTEVSEVFTQAIEYAFSTMKKRASKEAKKAPATGAKVGAKEGAN